MLHFPEVFSADKLTKSATCSPTNPVCLRLDNCWLRLREVSSSSVDFTRNYQQVKWLVILKNRSANPEL